MVQNPDHFLSGSLLSAYLATMPTLKNIRPNGPMHLTTMPSALLSQILRTQDLRQKQVVAGDRGRSEKK